MGFDLYINPVQHMVILIINLLTIYNIYSVHTTLNLSIILHILIIFDKNMSYKLVNKIYSTYYWTTRDEHIAAWCHKILQQYITIYLSYCLSFTNVHI